MQKKFLPENRDKLTKDEQLCIGSWTDNKYFVIQSVIAKNFKSLSEKEVDYIEKAKTLLNMFSKYNSEYPKDKAVFRGLKFNQSENDEVKKYQELLKHIHDAYQLQKSYRHLKIPFSTSKKIDIAKRFANANIEDFNSIILIFQKRISDELDLSNLSSANESEILIQGGLKYKVIKFANIKGILYATLEEVL
jgi:hypothetical protein